MNIANTTDTDVPFNTVQRTNNCSFNTGTYTISLTTGVYHTHGTFYIGGGSTDKYIAAKPETTNIHLDSSQFVRYFGDSRYMDFHFVFWVTNYPGTMHIEVYHNNGNSAPDVYNYYDTWSGYRVGNLE